MIPIIGYGGMGFGPHNISGWGFALNAENRISLDDTGGDVSAWDDDTGQNRGCTQSDNNYRPDYLTGQWNGRSVVSYGSPGARLLVSGDLTGFTNLSGMTLILVTQFLGTDQGVQFFNTEYSLSVSVYLNEIYIQVGGSGNVATFGYTSLNPAIFVIVFDGTKTGNSNRLKVYVDGVLKTLNFISGSMPTTAGFSKYWLGATNTGTYPVSAKQAFVGFLPKAISATERAYLTDGFSKWYGIPVTEQFDPLSPGNVDLAYDAGQGITLDGSNNIQYWDTYGGITARLTNGASYRPAYNATAMNGYPAATCTDKGLSCSSGLGSLDDRTARTLVIVFKTATYSNSTLVDSGMFSQSDYVRLTSSEIRSWVDYSNYLAASTSDTGPQIIIDVFNGSWAADSRHKLYRNGSLIGTGAGPATLGTIQAYKFPWNSSGGDSIAVSDLVRYSVALDSSWLSYLNQGFGAKYGITIS